MEIPNTPSLTPEEKAEIEAALAAQEADVEKQKKQPVVKVEQKPLEKKPIVQEQPQAEKEAVDFADEKIKEIERWEDAMGKKQEIKEPVKKTPEPEEHPFGKRSYTKEEESEMYDIPKTEAAEKPGGKTEEIGKKAEADPDLVNLTGKRIEFLKVEKEFQRAEKEYNNVKNLAEGQGLKNMDRIKSEGVENYRRLKPIKDAYEDALKKYGRSLLVKERERLDSQKDLNPEERIMHFKRFNAEAVEKFVLDEDEKLNQERTALLPKFERGIFGKAFDKWQKMPNAQKWAIAAATATGVAFIGGGAAIPAMTYFGYRLGRAALGTIAGRLAGGAYEKLIIKRGREKTSQRIKIEAVKEINAADNFEKIMDVFDSQSVAAREKIAKQKKKEKWQRVGQAAVIAGTAGLASWGAGKMFDNAWGTTGGAPGQPEKISGKPSVSSGETPEMPGGKASLIKSPTSEGAAVLSQEAMAVPGFEDTVIVQKGDSVWKILEKQAGTRGLFDNLEGSPEEIVAKKTYIIDALKRQASETLGLENPDLIQPGQRLNIGGLFGNEDRLVEVFNTAQNLTAEQVENIGNYVKGAKVAAENLTENTVQAPAEVKVSTENVLKLATSEPPVLNEPSEVPPSGIEKSEDELSLGKQEIIKQVADNSKWVEAEGDYLENLKKVGFDGLSDRSYVAVKNSSLNDLLYQFRDIPNLDNEDKIIQAFKNFPEKPKLSGSGIFGTYTQADFLKHAKLANWVKINLDANPAFADGLKNGTIGDFMRWTETK